MPLQRREHFVALGISIDKRVRTHLTIVTSFQRDGRDVCLFPCIASSLVEETRDIGWGQ